jgi:hypothetical protein
MGNQQLLLMQPIEFTASYNKTKILNKLQNQLDSCGKRELGVEVCTNEKCQNIMPVMYRCGLRICNCPECVKKRSFYIRERLEPYFKNIPNLVMLYLTLQYEIYDFRNKKDIVAVYKRIRKLCKKLREGYGFDNFIANFDVIAKPNGKLHLHFNIGFNAPDVVYKQLHDREYFAKVCLFIKSEWKERINLSPKYKLQQRKSAVSYFVKRTAEINPAPKRGVYIPISLSRYYDLFYKTHFIRKFYWSILVVSRNKSSFADVFLTKKCPKCGSDMMFSPNMEEFVFQT